ncbi:hypothetical protein PGT21_029236 [Puccinia graminis f. sp. tritici]|uniref:Uncharacterized protein n=1 Tax=Puccinia graminis f. sp. tritici TaxID=56615 RepID=A0A5B0QXF4_PUCGR|nr:hypothetical protein PGT21_029236 [Puccinia graminis f. sp. tritici]
MYRSLKPCSRHPRIANRCHGPKLTTTTPLLISTSPSQSALVGQYVCSSADHDARFKRKNEKPIVSLMATGSLISWHSIILDFRFLLVSSGRLLRLLIHAFRRAKGKIQFVSSRCTLFLAVTGQLTWQQQQQRRRASVLKKHVDGRVGNEKKPVEVGQEGTTYIGGTGFLDLWLTRAATDVSPSLVVYPESCAIEPALEQAFGKHFIFIKCFKASWTNQLNKPRAGRKIKECINVIVVIQSYNIMFTHASWISGITSISDCCLFQIPKHVLNIVLVDNHGFLNAPGKSQPLRSVFFFLFHPSASQSKAVWSGGV